MAPVLLNTEHRFTSDTISSPPKYWPRLRAGAFLVRVPMVPPGAAMVKPMASPCCDDRAVASSDRPRADGPPSIGLSVLNPRARGATSDSHSIPRRCHSRARGNTFNVLAAGPRVMCDARSRAFTGAKGISGTKIATIPPTILLLPRYLIGPALVAGPLLCVGLTQVSAVPGRCHSMVTLPHFCLSEPGPGYALGPFL